MKDVEVRASDPDRILFRDLEGYSLVINGELRNYSDLTPEEQMQMSDSEFKVILAASTRTFSPK